MSASRSTPETVGRAAPLHLGDSSGVSRPPAEPEAPWPTGTLGRWDPRLVRVLTVLGFAIPVVGYLVLIQHYQVNAVLGDQWDDVSVIRQSYLHFPDWSSLWSVHNGNRIFFPNLIVLGLAYGVHFNIDVEEYLGALMLFAATALLIWSHKRRSPRTPLIAYCPVAFLTLTFAQWSNALWGFQIAWFLVVLALALVIALLDRPRLTWWVFIAAALASVVGSYSSLQGLVIWPVGLLLLFLRRRPRWTYASWIALAAATTALYFYNYPNAGTANSPRLALEHPYMAAKFFFFALGDVVGMQMKFGQTSANGLIMAFGITIFVLAVVVLIRWGIRRDTESGAPIGIAMIVFGLLFDVMITEGRLAFGIWGASQSRYTTNDVLVLAGIYLTVVGEASVRAHRTHMATSPTTAGKRLQPATAWLRVHVQRVDSAVIRRVAITAIVIQVVFSVHFGIQGAQQQHQTYVITADVTRNVDHASNGGLKYVLGLFNSISGQTLRSDIEFLREHHLSLFG